MPAPIPAPAGRRPPQPGAALDRSAALAAGLLMIAGVGIILWSSAPGLLVEASACRSRPKESPLRLVDNPIERRDLTNGSELFAVSGKVLNPSATAQRVPDIRADLRDAGGRIVYSWTITPQQRTLGSQERDRLQLRQARRPRLVEAARTELRRRRRGLSSSPQKPLPAPERFARGVRLPAAGRSRRYDTCGRGGTGRRAALRWLWPKGRGSSSLLDRTNSPNRCPVVGRDGPAHGRDRSLASHRWLVTTPSAPLTPRLNDKRGVP